MENYCLTQVVQSKSQVHHTQEVQVVIVLLFIDGQLYQKQFVQILVTEFGILTLVNWL